MTPRCSSRSGALVPRGVPAVVRLATLALVAGALAAEPAGAQITCEPCHGELELLRQHTATPEDARALLVPGAVVDASAHGGFACSRCHTGYVSYPHPAPARTRTCASCHADERAAWAEGAHAGDLGAGCLDCHGVHDVLGAEARRTPDGVRSMRRACAACHFEPRIPEDDPHADSVSCGGCHEPHRTLSPADPESSVHVLNQASTCGACHAQVAEAWGGDVHGAATPALAVPGPARPQGATGSEPPACTACHGAHGMLGPSHARFDQDMVDRCSACHEDYADTYFGTYHGKATALGSEVVATCDRCHGAHGIFPASDDRSLVSEERLVETCAQCHERARPAFVRYDAHPDPMDRARNAPLFYSFIFMNAMLFSVLGVFTLHTGLWWVRLVIDRRRGVGHAGRGGHA